MTLGKKGNFMYIYKEKTGPWIWFLRILFTLATIMTIGFIFYNSSQIGDISGGRSAAVMEFYNNQIAPALGLPYLTHHQIRKLAHFAEYALEGFFLMLSLRVYTSRYIRHISWPALIGLLTALGDETLQKFMPGRTSQVTDVWIDSAGLCAGMGLALLVLLIFRAFAILIFGVKKTHIRSLEEIQAFEQGREV